MTDSQSRRSQDFPNQEPAPLPSSASAQDFSAILDDLDSILEKNASTFIQRFVQEDGQ